MLTLTNILIYLGILLGAVSCIAGALYWFAHRGDKRQEETSSGYGDGKRFRE